MNKQKTPRDDVYTRVTNRIIADLEQGVRPWQKPWDAGNAAGALVWPRRASGAQYRGINVMLLWGAAAERGYQSAIWMTYKQATELGAQVRRGETGSLVVYANSLKRTETDAKGEETEREIPFMKGYTVFNVEQIDGLPAHYYHKADEQTREPIARIEQAESYFANTGATIRHGGDKAYYSPALDHIQMPLRESFWYPESYYAVLAHETTHWTAHPSRLARELGKRFGTRAYAAEELIAEMGSAFLCADLGITPEVRPDQAAYLASWLDVLKADSRAIFTAAAQAQRAVDFLHGLQAVKVAA